MIQRDKRILYNLFYFMIGILLFVIIVNNIFYGCRYMLQLRNYIGVENGVQYNALKHQFFKISNFATDKPLHIIYNNDFYLYFDPEKYTVSLRRKDNNNVNDDTTKWIIEKEKEGVYDVYYIKCVYANPYFNQYLGCPNKNRDGYLYTTKNRFTKWKIIHIRGDSYELKYIGTDFDKDDISIVISRYREDPSWALPYKDIVVLYNKGADDIDNDFVDQVIKLPNIGREGHTILYHMIENYDKLTNTTIFAQGDPFEHNNTFLFGIDNYEKNKSVQPLTNRYSAVNPPPEFVNKYKTVTDYGLEYLVYKVDGNLYCKDKEYYDWGVDNINNIYNELNIPKKDTIMETFLELAKFPLDNIDRNIFRGGNIYMFGCATFSITKDKIRQHKPDVYKGLSDTIVSENVHGYALERLWYFIFINNKHEK